MFKSTQNNLLNTLKIITRMTIILIHFIRSISVELGFSYAMIWAIWVNRHIVKKKKKRIVVQNLYHNFTFCHRCNRTEVYIYVYIFVVLAPLSPPTYMTVTASPYGISCVHNSNQIIFLEYVFYYIGNWIIYLQVIRISRYWIANYENFS